MKRKGTHGYPVIRGSGIAILRMSGLSRMELAENGLNGG
jgi:hypothetical protein